MILENDLDATACKMRYTPNPKPLVKLGEFACKMRYTPDPHRQARSSNFDDKNFDDAALNRTPSKLHAHTTHPTPYTPHPTPCTLHPCLAGRCPLGPGRLLEGTQRTLDTKILYPSLWFAALHHLALAASSKARRDASLSPARASLSWSLSLSRPAASCSSSSCGLGF